VTGFAFLRWASTVVARRESAGPRGIADPAGLPLLAALLWRSFSC